MGHFPKWRFDPQITQILIGEAERVKLERIELSQGAFFIP